MLGFQKGDVFAIAMPMHCNSVIIYLAIILAGYVVAGIADSFAPPEIAMHIECRIEYFRLCEVLVLLKFKILLTLDRCPFILSTLHILFLQC